MVLVLLRLAWHDRRCMSCCCKDIQYGVDSLRQGRKTFEKNICWKLQEQFISSNYQVVLKVERSLVKLRTPLESLDS